MTDDDIAVTIPTSTVDALKFVVAFGGYVSLAYLLGYTYWWAYLDVFAATFVISQVPIVDVLFGSIASVAPIIAVGSAVLFERNFQPNIKKAGRLLFVMTMVVFLVTIVDFFAGDYVIDRVRSDAYGVVALCVCVGAAACAYLAILEWRKSAWQKFVLFVVAFTLYAFVLCPAAAGLNFGFFDAAKAESEFAVAHVADGRHVYVLFVTNESVYGILRPSGSSSRVVVIPWSAVRDISGARKLRRDRSGDWFARWLYR